MNYFAKYLPVEGEVKPGDIYLQEYTKDVQFQWGRANRKDYDDGAYKDRKKLQLFLCSRDIQVGDKIQKDNGVGLDNVSMDEEGDPEEELERIRTMGERGWFKVIGPISPQAIWVKEGDEFEEDEINRQCYDDSGSKDEPWEDCVDGEFITAKEWWNDSPEKFKRVQIKCQNCKTFH